MGIYKSLMYTLGHWENCDWGRAIPRKGIHKWDFRCYVRSTFSLIFFFSGVHMQRRSMQLLPSSLDQPMVADRDHHDLIADLMTSMILASSPSLMCACDPDILAWLMTFLILPSSSRNKLSVMTFWFVVGPFGSCWGKWSKPLGLFYDPSFLITDRSGDHDLLFFLNTYFRSFMRDQWWQPMTPSGPIFLVKKWSVDHDS